MHSLLNVSKSITEAIFRKAVQYALDSVLNFNYCLEAALIQFQFNFREYVKLIGERGLFSFSNIPLVTGRPEPSSSLSDIILGLNTRASQNILFNRMFAKSLTANFDVLSRIFVEIQAKAESDRLIEFISFPPSR